MDLTNFFISTVLTIITAATPLTFAATGELLVEKSGVLNLGVEGMMVLGAIDAFAVGVSTGSAVLAVIAGIVAGVSLAMVFGFLVLVLLANQVATGLALTIFGIGLSALIGHEFVGMTFAGIPNLNIPLITQIPILGPILFGQDALVYLSVSLVIGTNWFLTKTRAGLVLKAVGENHNAAHSIGMSVVGVRFQAVLFGGAMAGLGGAYLSLVYTPLWVENMTAGRGWIALALVVFAAWRPWRAFLGAYLFGGIAIIQLHIQGAGLSVPAQFLSMLPYLATIIVLVMISKSSVDRQLKAPGSLGKIFYASS